MIKKEIPTSKGLPLIGHLLDYRKDRLKFLVKKSKELGDIFKVKIGPKEILVINSPDYIQHVMQKNMKNYIKKTNFDQIFGQSIFIANDDDWKKQRQMIQPLMSTKYIKKSIPHILEVAQDSLSNFISKSNTGEDVRSLFTQTTFDTIMRTIVGIEASSNHDELDSALFVITDYLSNDNYNLLKLPEAIDPKKKAFKKSVKLIDDIVYKSIEQAKREEFDDKLIQIMLKHTKEIPNADEFIRNNIVTMMFAGYETAALSLTWMTYLLSQNEDWFKKCSLEAQGFDIQTLSFESLSNLPHIEACILETMRLYPPGWGFLRFSKNADQIDGFEIKAGEIILVSPFLIHRDSKRWKTPLCFDPNRFLNKAPTHYGHYQFIPFGAGPRICTGMQFAMIEMKIIMLNLLKNYRPVLVGDHPIVDARATLFSHNKYQVKLENI